jgi:D-alanine-D-alanine ligase
MSQLDDDIEHIVERRIKGKDLTVTMFEGRTLEVIEIALHYGFSAYMNKYTPGYSNRICPSTIP